MDLSDVLKMISEKKADEKEPEGKEPAEGDEKEETTGPKKLGVGEWMEWEDGTEFKCVFRKIIVFTNDKSDDNKTLKNIRDAIKWLAKKGKAEPELFLFYADEAMIDPDCTELRDKDGTLSLDELDNTDTLIFARLSVQGEERCEHVVEVLQDRGFLVLNPVRQSALASNKYETATLLEKGGIPQPPFCHMEKDTLKNEKLFKEAMKRLYKDWSDDPDKNEDKDIVVKILDGHGGTGVAMIDGKRLIAWLQLVFAVDPERQLILQKKEEADGGDIRVHVVTHRDSQTIVAAMKRVKLGGDFRSNVSLGAEAEPVELTEKQKEIALRCARLSGLTWCAVDIMPLKDGRDVVLELNASPGTAGISEVIGENFILRLMTTMSDPADFMLQNKVAGYRETVSITINGHTEDMLALLDTGNGATSHLEVGEYSVDGDTVSFKWGGKTVKRKVVKYSTAKGTGDGQEERPVIEADSVKIGRRRLNNALVAIVKKRDKSTNVLMNRDTLSRMGYSVNPGARHILTPEIEKIEII